METPSPFSQGPEKPQRSAEQIENFEQQKSWLKISEPDCEITSKNKKKILKLLEKLEKKGIFVGESSKDYKELGRPMIGGQARVYPKFLISDPNKERKAIKNIQFTLNEPLSVREIDLISVINHENVIKIEKVFLEKLPKGKLAINIVMPFVNHDFLSWLTSDSAEWNQENRMTDQTASYSRIPENKRSFEEVRDVLIGTLKGIDQLHLRDIIHLDIKFNNVLVDSNNNALIADLGLAQSTKKLAIKFGFTRGFVAPEVLELFKEVGKKGIGEEETKITTTAISHCFEKDSFEKGDYFTIKADMYSFGVMLYRLFVDEKEEISNENVSREKINARIQQIFPKEKEPVPELLIQDLEIIIKNLLQKDKDLRFDSGILLFEHPYFNKEVTKLPTKPEPTPIDEELISGISDPEKLFEIGCRFLEGIDIERDIKKGRRIIEDLSETFPPAKYFTGWMKEVGYGGLIDKARGRKMREDSAQETYTYFEPKGETGDPFALLAIGKMFQSGYFMPKDVAKELGFAFKLFRYAAQKGNSLAQTCVGEQYLDKELEFHSEKLAAQYFELAANQNNPLAQTRLFCMLRETDFETALKYIQPAVDQGFAEAQRQLGFTYTNKGLYPNFDKEEEGIKLLKLSGDQGDLSALNFLGQYYEFARKPGAKYPQMAAILYKKAATQGHIFAMCNLGRFYEHQKDFKSAMEWYEEAANNGSHVGLTSLGYAYEKGVLGKEKDIQKAIIYYQKAISGKTKSDKAMQNLGLIYLRGAEGVPRDLGKAKEHFLMALAQNKRNTKVKAYLEELEKMEAAVAKPNE